MKTILTVLIGSLLSLTLYAQNKTGCISGDCSSGKGTYLFNNGDKYEGDFKDSHLNGFGKYIDSYGNIYTGDFKDDKFNGKGEFVRTDGTKYIGEFVNGKRSGLGTQWYSETYKEKGKWENDRYVEPAEFEDFVISESYDFCTEFLKIFYASANSFKDIKGKQVSEYITDSYYCTIKIKELVTVEINDKTGYSGIYFKGDKTEGQKKLEELYKMVLACTNKSCCTFQNKFLNGVNEKKYEFYPATINGWCSTQVVGANGTMNLLKVKIILSCKIQNNTSDVTLTITNP